MANYNDLITAIDSVIKTNNRREITGQLLQNVLNTMVGSLGENYQLAGFATPTTNPHQPDQNVFYVASQAGVYTQFDNIVLGDGISFLMWKNGAWTSQTISMVTQSWVQQNFVSKEWFRKVFRVYDEDGLEIVPNDMDSVVDNIKAMVGLWTNEYLSALGMGRDGGGSTQTLAQLNDVQLGTLENGDALVYNTAIHKWENKQIQTGVDMSVVWAALAANTNEQINASHLATALSGYVTTAALGTALQNYATQSWVNQNFITVEWFDKLFQLYNGTEAEANKIAPNGALPIDQTNLNIEAMFGFWTKKYISALGQGDDGTTSYTTLAQLNDVTLTNPTANQVLTYNGTHWVNAAVPSGASSLSGLTDVDISPLADKDLLQWDYATGKWKNVVLPTIMSGYATQSWVNTQLGSYLPLSGGIMIGSINMQNGDIYSTALGLSFTSGYIRFGTTKETILRSNSSTNSDINIYLPAKTGTLTTTGDFKTVNGQSLIGSGDINVGGGGGAYLPLSGGTMTGAIYMQDSGYIHTSSNNTLVVGSSSVSNTTGLLIHVPSGNGSFGGNFGIGGSTETGYVLAVHGKTYSQTGFDCDGDYAYCGQGVPILRYNGNYTGGYSTVLSANGNKLVFRPNGDNNTSGQAYIDSSGNFVSVAGVTALSDARHKDIVQDTQLSVEEIAHMPSVVYRWKDGREDDGLHVGSIAQDWERVLPEVVLRANDDEGTLSLQYGVAALIAVITTARKVMTHEEEIALLKTRVSALEKENGELIDELNKIKAA